MRAWHVHIGLLAPDRAMAGALRGCAYVLHAVNMWGPRLRPDAAKMRRGTWKRMLPGNMTVRDFTHRCLPPNVTARAQVLP